MAVTEALLDRAGEIKRALVRFGEDRRFRRERRAFIDDVIAETGLADDATRANALDSFIHGHMLNDGATVLEHFAFESRMLTEAERDMVLGWEDVVRGAFEITGSADLGVDTLNLVDELPYRVYSNQGGGFMRQFQVGQFLAARIVPLDDGWMLSGVCSALAHDQRDDALVVRDAIIQTDPGAPLRNPAKAAEAKEQTRRIHRRFIEVFGSDDLTLTREQVPETFKRFITDVVAFVLDAPDAHTSTTERIDALIADARDADYPEETIGLVFDPEFGPSVIPEYGRIAAVFDDPGLAQSHDNYQLVRDFLEAPELPPSTLRRLVQRDVDKGERVLQAVLHDPSFRWAEMADDLFLMFKPEYIDLDAAIARAEALAEAEGIALPKLFGRAAHGGSRASGLELPAPARLELPSPELAYPPVQMPRHIERHGRNEPCPCGSGKKFKKCHGA